MSSAKERDAAWLRDNINFFLKPMLAAMLREKPASPKKAMIDWLEKYRYEQAQSEAKSAVHSGSDTESETLDMEQVIAKRQKAKKKLGVSAEAYGAYNQLGSYAPRVVEKSPEQIHQIRDVLKNSFMFAALDDKSREIVIQAMDVKNCSPSEYVIRQGEDGNELYIVNSGKLECFKKFPGADEPKFLCEYTTSGVFGELSLLYSIPRSASIVAKEDSVLFCLDRDTFNHIVKSASIKRRERYDDFINRIEVLQELDPYERGKICDVLDVLKFKKGDLVVTEGEVGDKFYFIEEGTAVALKKDENGEKKEVFAYKALDYFGELALLGDGTRKASIQVTSEEFVVAYLTIDSFRRLLGPLEDILKRNTEKYQRYVKTQ